MPALIEAIDIKRKMYFEYDNAPYHCLEVEISRPTARGGQTLVRVKMRNMLTRAVFDRTFKAGDKFGTIESYKSTSDLYSPVAGTVIERNEPLVDDQPTNRKGDPKPVNDDAFGTGWMVKIKLAPGATLDHLLTAEKYDEQLASEGH